MGDRVAVLRDGRLQQYGTPRSLYERPANVFVATFIGSPSMNLYEAGLDSGGARGSGGVLGASGSGGAGGVSTSSGVYGTGGVGGAAVVLGSQRLELPASVAARLGGYADRKIIVGIRPEDLVVRGAGAVRSGGGAVGSGVSGAVGSGGAVLVADVRLVEVLGSEQDVYFSIDATAAGTAAADESAEASILAASAPNGVARVDPRAGGRADPRAGVRAGGRVTFVIDPARLHFFDPDTGGAISGLVNCPPGITCHSGRVTVAGGLGSSARTS